MLYIWGAVFYSKFLTVYIPSLLRNMNIDVILDVNLRFIFTHSCDNILVSQGIARI